MNVHLKLETMGHFINGVAVTDGARKQPVFNPATGQVVREVSLASRATVEQAIAAAAAAFPAWRDTPPLKRARDHVPLQGTAGAERGAIAALITEEHGKVFDDALGEFQRGVEVVEYACAAPELLKGEHAKNVGTGDRFLVRVPAARRGGRHHAVQLPGDGPDVDVPDGDRLRQHLRAEALGA